MTILINVETIHLNPYNLTHQDLLTLSDSSSIYCNVRIHRPFSFKHSEMFSKSIESLSVRFENQAVKCLRIESNKRHEKRGLTMKCHT